MPSGREYVVVAGAAAQAARLVGRGVGARFTGRVASFAFRRALRGGSSTWLYAGAALEGVHLLQRLMAPRPDIAQFVLRPGESIEIREIPRQGGKR